MFVQRGRREGSLSSRARRIISGGARAPSRARQRGQSVTEFALVVPILLMLFVAIADFGRIFAAGIAIDAATRNAAETAANEYLANPPGALNLPAPGADQAYYTSLRAYTAKVVCAELRSLPNTTYDAGTQTCRDVSGSGPNLPAVVVCVHDGADGGCAAPAVGGTLPASCTVFTPSATNSQQGTGRRWVEVRTCYQFTPILQMPLLPFGDIWLQRTRTFTIPCYFVLGTDECGV